MQRNWLPIVRSLKTPDASMNSPATDRISSTREQFIRDFFNQLRADKMHLCDDFYHSDILFQDPLGEIRGLNAMKAYYSNLYKNVLEIRFEFKEMTSSERKSFAPWLMHLRASGLNSGNWVIVPGVSEFEFDPSSQKVIYHRDYFDMGAFVYEHIPILKNILKYIRSKLKHTDA